MSCMARDNITNTLTFLVLTTGIVLIVFFGRPLIYKDVRADITSQIVEFGGMLKSVSLLSETASTQIEQVYAPYVAPELLEKWSQDPSEALGRLVSSPWPDRIEVTNMKKLSDTQYEVTGNVLEVTSADAPGKASASYEVRMKVERRRDAWLITSVEKSSYDR